MRAPEWGQQPVTIFASLTKLIGHRKGMEPPSHGYDHNVNLTEELDSFVAAKVASGR